MLIIPTYNERDNVDCLVSRVRKAAPLEPILFVDDNSPDGTQAAIRSLQEREPGIHLMARPGKGGYGSACRDAMRKILQENLGPYIIQFDADLSHPPELLPTMIDALKTWQVVIGSRYVAGGGSQNWDFRRKCLSYGANLYARFLTGVPAHDLTSGFVGYQVATLREIDLAQIRSDGYAFLMEMKFNLHRRGAKFHEFPIIFAERESGKSKFSRKVMLEGVRFPLKAMKSRMLS
jgi:dolichol-phosphate mannosyltransferase